MKKPSTPMTAIKAIGPISKWNEIGPSIPRTTQSVTGKERISVATAETVKVAYITVLAPMRSDSMPP